MRKKAILVVSFGTSYRETRENTIEQIERTIAGEFPGYEVRRAFSSRIVIRILKERDGVFLDTEEEGLERLFNEGYSEVIVQPTHVICGFEYDKISAVVQKYKGCFLSISLGKPLLYDDHDYEDIAHFLTDITEDYRREDTAVLFMGHGSDHPANASYGKLQTVLRRVGGCRYGIGTVEGELGLNQVLVDIREWKVKRIVLHPLMIVAGDHAVEDMAGDGEDSWKTVFTEHGYEVDCIIKGMGEYPALGQMFVKHIHDVI